MADETKIARLAEIQQEIKALAEEGVKIANEEKVTFSLSDTPMSDGYGIGGLCYVPEGSTTDRWGDPSNRRTNSTAPTTRMTLVGFPLRVAAN